jgi:hypothetical protein
MNDTATFEQLEEDALQACGWRHHVMKLTSNTPLASGREQRTYECQNDECCGYVQTMTDPPPNGIDIGGTAVAMGCPIGTDYHWDVTKRTYGSES